jgi:outer membrane protein assembly factor BamE
MSDFLRRGPGLGLVFIFCTTLSACGTVDGTSRVQVRDVLGTSLLSSVFHEDRWDYVFTLQRQGVAPQARRVTVFFKNAELLRFEADTLPSESEFAASLGKMNMPDKLPALEATSEALQKLPVPTKAPVAAPLPPLPASYPPLESPTR